MVVLHIAHIGADNFSGVNVAIPQQIRAQQQFADAALLNLTGERVDGIAHQVSLGAEGRIGELPPPYCTPDIVIFHEVYRPMHLQLSRELKKRGIPYVIVPHGGLTRTAQQKKWLKKAVANRLLFDRFLRGAAAVQYLSARERDQSRFNLRNFIGTNGIRTEWRKTAFSAVGMRMVYIGRLEISIKGLDLLLEAAEREGELLRAHRCLLDLYGPDENGAHDRLRSLIAERGLTDVVAAHSAVAGEEKAAVLLAADCFVQSSRSEGMSMGILEALGCGLPCIVTEGTGMAELVRERDAGWACDTTAAGIAGALRQAVADREKWKGKSEHAAELVKAHFCWETVARETVEQYARIAAERRHSDVSR